MRSLFIITRYDLRFTLKSPMGTLFQICYALLGLLFFYYLSQGMARDLLSRENLDLISLMVDPKLLTSLFIERPATLSLFYLLGVLLIPATILLMGANQSAPDLANRFIRFIVPRCERRNFLLGRYLSATLFMALPTLVMWLIATLIALGIDPQPWWQQLSYGVTILVAMLSLIAVMQAWMAIFSLWCASVSLALLSAGTLYFVLLAAINTIALRYPVLDLLTILLPGLSPGYFLKPELSAIWAAALSQLLYAALLLRIALALLKKRDL